jgi:hypothetical protein
MSTLIWGFPNQEAVTSNQLGGIQQYKEGILTEADIINWSGTAAWYDFLPATTYPNVIIINKLILEGGVTNPQANGYTITPGGDPGDNNNIFIASRLGQCTISDDLLIMCGSGYVSWTVVEPGSIKWPLVPPGPGYAPYSVAFEDITANNFDYLKIGIANSSTIVVNGDPGTGAQLKYKLWYQIHQLG